MNRIKELQPDGSWKKPAVEREKSLRKKVLSNEKCRYCYSHLGLTLDHILPKSRGGSNTIDNYQPLCFYCNGRKGNKTDSEVSCIFTDIRQRGVWYDWEKPFETWLGWLEIVTIGRKPPPGARFKTVDNPEVKAKNAL